MHIAIRAATGRDAEAWQRLFASVAAEGRWIGAEAPVDDFAPAMFEHHLGATDSLFLVAEADGASVGWITAELDEVRVAELGMGIIDGYRAQGIGRAMMDAVLDWAATARVDRLRLDVFPHNTAAIALYRRFGFEEVDRRSAAWPRRNGERWDLITMERAVTGGWARKSR